VTFTISKVFEFSAAHALVALPEDHPCSRFHGHNYVVEITLTNYNLDHRGFVRDYGELKVFKQWIDDTLDHRWLGYGTLGRVDTDARGHGGSTVFAAGGNVGGGGSGNVAASSGTGGVGSSHAGAGGGGAYHAYPVSQMTRPVFDFNPTAENIAKHIYELAVGMFPEVTTIGISETPKTWAYYPNGS
jgi:queuosine biosynthesis protein QueD